MNLQSWRRIPAPKSIIYVGEYIIMRWVIFFMTALPYDIAASLVRNFVRFGYGLAGKYRNITAENIRLANPPIVTTPDQANHLALRTFEYFGLSFVHMLYMDRLIHLKEKKHISFENTAAIDRALMKKRGALLVSGHIGNWEVGINELAKNGYPINLVAFQYVNPYLNNMMNQFRLRCKVNIIPTKGAIKHCETALNRGEAVIMLVDQTGREDGVEAQFFGRTAPAMWGPANLHLKTGAPIIPYGTTFTTKTQSSQRTRSDRVQRIHYTIKVGNMIEFNPSGNKNEDIKQLAQLYLSEIEKIIRRAPEQWIWFHRRWKKYK
jgi:KDO2-lipid IV(A) lauroyltransferase